MSSMFKEDDYSPEPEVPGVLRSRMELMYFMFKEDDYSPEPGVPGVLWSPQD